MDALCSGHLCITCYLYIGVIFEVVSRTPQLFSTSFVLCKSGTNSRIQAAFQNPFFHNLPDVPQVSVKSLQGLQLDANHMIKVCKMSSDVGRFEKPEIVFLWFQRCHIQGQYV